jgi:hypothetical protein
MCTCIHHLPLWPDIFSIELFCPSLAMESLELPRSSASVAEWPDQFVKFSSTLNNCSHYFIKMKNRKKMKIIAEITVHFVIAYNDL